jgi:hypothetical protein
VTDYDHPMNGVRITNREIYDLLVRVDTRAGRVEQTIKQVIEPTLTKHEMALQAKADRAELDRVLTRTEKLELRMYGILAGLITGLIGLSQLGVIG